MAAPPAGGAAKAVAAQMLTARAIAHALGGYAVGENKSRFVAPCPAHDDRTPSLSLRDGDAGKVLLFCHAGCNSCDVIEALRSRGLWDSGPRAHVRTVACRAKPNTARSDLARALTILRESVPISGTLGARYLQSRGVDVSDLPACLRFHPALWHKRSGEHWPAMVTPLRDAQTNEVVGVQRTYLARDGSGKAPVDLQRMVLGRMKGACVKLTPNESVAECLHVAEGTETALKAMQSHNWRPIWCLPASAIANLPVLPGITCLTIAADHDQPGLEAAQKCAERWVAAGVEVFVRWPAGLGRDYADTVS